MTCTVTWKGHDITLQESLMHRRLLIDGRLVALQTMGMYTYAVHLEAKIPDGEGAGVTVVADDPARLLSWFGCSLSIGGVLQERRSFSCTGLSRVAEGLLVASLISLVLMFVAALAFGLENAPWFVLILPGVFLALWMCSSAIYFVDFHMSAARLRRKHLGIRFWRYTRERFSQSIGPLFWACLLAVLQVCFFFIAYTGAGNNLVPIAGVLLLQGGVIWLLVCRRRLVAASLIRFTTMATAVALLRYVITRWQTATVLMLCCLPVIFGIGYTVRHWKDGYPNAKVPGPGS